MTDAMEPSDQERADLPIISQQYMEALEAERDKLNDAVWQALDDMRSGQSVCLATKQMLADAYIRDSDPAEWPEALEDKG